MVFFVFAGLGESNFSQDPDLIWPHESTARETINGTVFAGFGITCEARPKTTRTDTLFVDGKETYKKVVTSVEGDGIGVFCHELSHALGLPDFYDIDNVEFGMDLWSVMDYGQYAGNGFCPGGYTAYERDFMGWQSLQELTAPQVLTIPCFADGGGGYKIVNEANPNEYYIIENRQPKGWDTSACGGKRHGLQVTHVDHSASLWNLNKVNTQHDTYNPLRRQHMTIIAANNNYNGTNKASTMEKWMDMLAGNLYPGNTYNYNLTDESTPAAEVYAGGLLHKPLRNITENEDGTVTVCFRTNGILGTPEVKDAENVDMTELDVLWEEVPHATRYACEMYLEDALLSSDTLSATRHHYDGLTTGSKLRFRVKAMADTPEDWLDSEWSDFASLETLTDLIPSIQENGNAVEAPCYDLSGRRITTTPLRGIYIHDGRKTVRK